MAPASATSGMFLDANGKPRQHFDAIPGGLSVGVPGDMLFPYALQHELYRELQAAGASASLWKLDSEYGHDAFLADQNKLAELLRASGIFGERTARASYVGVGAKPLREIRIGMIGCGVVGGGVLELLARQEAQLAARYAVRFRVTKIAVRDLAKPRPNAHGIALITDALQLDASIAKGKLRSGSVLGFSGGFARRCSCGCCGPRSATSCIETISGTPSNPIF